MQNASDVLQSRRLSVDDAAAFLATLDVDWNRFPLVTGTDERPIMDVDPHVLAHGRMVDGAWSGAVLTEGATTRSLQTVGGPSWLIQGDLEVDGVFLNRGLTVVMGNLTARGIVSEHAYLIVLGNVAATELALFDEPFGTYINGSLTAEQVSLSRNHHLGVTGRVSVTRLVHDAPADIDVDVAATRFASLPMPTATTIRAISERFMSMDGKSCVELIDHANAWVDVLIAAGHEDHLRTLHHGVLPRLETAESGATESEIAAAESSLGFALPPSFRRFLTDVGHVEFVGCEVQTCLVHELASASETLTAHLLHNNSPLLTDDVEVLQFSREESDAGVYLTNLRDFANEAPFFKWWHDDTFGSQADLDACRSIVEAGASYEPPPADTVPVVTNDLTTVVDELLDGEGSQRDRLAAIIALRDRLTTADDTTIVNVLHAVRRAIKSPKVTNDREAFITELRRDGGAPGDRLPSLGNSIAQPPPGFPTFDVWLQMEIERLIERTADQTPTR